MGSIPMSLDPSRSLADHPASQRYQTLLSGGSLSSVRLNQGLGAANAIAGRAAESLRERRKRNRESREVQRKIETGQIRDLD
jgi:hypothetical protein